MFFNWCSTTTSSLALQTCSPQIAGYGSRRAHVSWRERHCEKLWSCQNWWLLTRMFSCYVRILLYWHYLQNEDILETHAEDLFALSHKYELVQLNNTCERFMASINSTFFLKYFVASIHFITDAKNILHYCRIIDIYGAPILENVSFIFIFST